jgi:hypothetical protein
LIPELNPQPCPQNFPHQRVIRREAVRAEGQRLYAVINCQGNLGQSHPLFKAVSANLLGNHRKVNIARFISFAGQVRANRYAPAICILAAFRRSRKAATFAITALSISVINKILQLPILGRAENYNHIILLVFL